jgi:hypothetical protein
MPTQTIDLNDALPTAPAGKQNNKWQSDPPSLDPTVIREVSNYTPEFVGDTGSGGLSGAVPAPAAGDAAAGKFLHADGAFEVLPTLVGDSGSGGSKGLAPAPAAGDAAAGKFLHADGSFELLPITIGFVMNDGSTGTNVGPMLVAPRAGKVTKCVVITKLSDGSTALTFKIKQNGTDVFSSDPTVGAATSPGTVSTFTTLTSSPLAIAAGDKFQIDITSGNGNWSFTAQLE